MRPLNDALGARERPMFRVAFGGAGLLVLLAAINVAGLFGPRARERGRELTTRSALGARWRDLNRVLMAEVAMVGVCGGLLGLVAAQLCLHVAHQLLPDDLRRLKAPVIDWRVAAFAMFAAVGPLLLCALVPAGAAISRAASGGWSRGGTTTTTGRSRGRVALLGAQAAVGVELLMPHSPGLEEHAVRQDAAMARMERVPGVRGVAMLGESVLDGRSGGSRFAVPPGGEFHWASDVPLGGSFFDVAGVDRLDGRLLTAEDIRAGRPLAVVSEDIAAAYWPGRRAVGQTLERDGLAVTVVGVVENARLFSQDDRRFGEIYLSASQPWRGTAVFLVRSSRPATDLADNLALVLRRDVPGVLARRAEPFEAAVAGSVRLQRFRMVLFGLAGGAGLLLVGVGVGGLVAMAVAHRRRELGIRASLGAAPRALSRMVVGEHLRSLTGGVVVGLVVSWWTTRLVSTFLYGIEARDARVWSGATVVLLVVATVAVWMPARYAAHVDPVQVLRAD